MKVTLKHSLVCCATIQAEPEKANKQRISPEVRKEMMDLRHQKATIEAQERLLKLKTALNLTDAQIPAWNDYESYMLSEQQDRHAMRSDMQQRRMENRTPPTSLELAEMNVQRLETQLSVARERLSVFTNLYGVLDDEQRQMVDKLSHKKIKRMAREARKRQKNRNN